MKRIFTYLVFLPSCTFSIVPAEIFPWAFFYALKSRTACLFMMIFFLLSLFSFFVSLFFWDLESAIIEFLRSYFAYVNAIAIFVYLINASHFELLRFEITSFRIFKFLIGLGLIQLTGVLDVFTPLLQMIVPRGYFRPLNEIGRGVTLLSSEPSRAGLELLLLYFVVRSKIAPTKKYLCDLLFFVYLAIVIKALSSIFIFIVIILLTYRSFSVLIVLFGSLAANYFLIDGRVGDLISILLTFDLNGIYEFLLFSSGFRGISFIAVFAFLSEFPQGGGVGRWQEMSIIGLELTGLSAHNFSYFRWNFMGEFASIRPVTFLSSVLLDFGVFGLIAFIIFLFKIKVQKSFFKDEKVVAAVVTLVFYGAIGSPFPWILLAFSYCAYMRSVRIGK